MCVCVCVCVCVSVCVCVDLMDLSGFVDLLGLVVLHSYIYFVTVELRPVKR